MKDEQSCTGWWEQFPLGRETMEGLRMSIEGSKITGSGYDSVGMFTFEGELSSEGDLVMIKEYLGAHRVLYKGEFDGERLMWGVWSLQWMKGPWEIRFGDGTGAGEEAVEKEAAVIGF